jgi:hypothetical protein
MIIPAGEYRYEIRRGAELVAVEEDTLDERGIRGVRLSANASSRFEAEAELDHVGRVRRIAVRYTRGPFTRDASYEVAEDFLRGSVSALAGRNVVAVKLGRFREVDTDLILFRALILAHLRERGEPRWTGRVAVIDSATLVAAVYKQSCHRASGGNVWIYETRMGDSEQIEIDAAGRILSRRDNRGIEATLTPVTQR